MSKASGNNTSGDDSDPKIDLEESDAATSGRSSTEKKGKGKPITSTVDAMYQMDDDVPMSFPQKLMDILNDEANAECIGWLPHGRGFLIYKKKKFANEILPRYFKVSKFTSFTRKLNRWGFHRVPKGPEMGAYYHRYFQRDDPRLILQMTCHSGTKAQQEKDQNPFVYGDVQQQDLIRQQLQQIQFQQMQLQQLQMQQQQLQAAMAFNNNGPDAELTADGKPAVGVNISETTAASTTEVPGVTAPGLSAPDSSAKDYDTSADDATKAENAAASSVDPTPLNNNDMMLQSLQRTKDSAAFAANMGMSASMPLPYMGMMPPMLATQADFLQNLQQQQKSTDAPAPSVSTEQTAAADV